MPQAVLHGFYLDCRRAKASDGERASIPNSCGKCLLLPVMTGQAAVIAAAIKGASSGSGKFWRGIGCEFRNSANPFMSSSRLVVSLLAKPNLGRFKTSAYSARIIALTTGVSVRLRIAAINCADTPPGVRSADTRMLVSMTARTAFLSLFTCQRDFGINLFHGNLIQPLFDGALL